MSWRCHAELSAHDLALLRQSVDEHIVEVGKEIPQERVLPALAAKGSNTKIVRFWSESKHGILTLQDITLLVCGETNFSRIDCGAVVRGVVVNIRFASFVDNLCGRENREALCRSAFPTS